MGSMSRLGDIDKKKIQQNKTLPAGFAELMVELKPLKFGKTGFILIAI